MSDRAGLRLGVPEPSDLQLSALGRLYVADLEARCDARYARNTRSQFDTLIWHLGDVAASELSEPLIIEYRRKRRQAGVSVATLNHETGALKRALTWAKRGGYIATNPLRELSPLPQRKRDIVKKRRALTDEERVRFMEAARAADARTMETGRRLVPQTPLYAAMLDTGARRGELLSSKWRHWRFDVERAGPLAGLAEVTFFDTKNGDDRTVPVLPDAADEILKLRELQEHLLERPPGRDDPVFLTPLGAVWRPTNVRNCLRYFYRVLEEAGIPRSEDGRSVDIHALRVSYNTELADSGVKGNTRAELLGHDPEVNRRHYVHSGRLDQRAAVRRLLERRLRLQGLPANAADLEDLLEALGLGIGEGPSNSPPIPDSGALPDPDGGLSQNLARGLAESSEGVYCLDIRQPPGPTSKLRPTPAKPATSRWRGQPSQPRWEHQISNLRVPGSSPGGRASAPGAPSSADIQSADIHLETDALPEGVVLRVVLVGQGRSHLTRGGESCDDDRFQFGDPT